MNAAAAAPEPRTIATLRGAMRGRAAPVDDDAIPAYIALAVMTALVIALAYALGFGFDTRDLPLMVETQVVVIALAMALRWRGLGRIATMLEAAALVLAASMATASLSVLVATTAFPYRDDGMATLDAAMGLSWRDMFAALQARHGLVSVMSRIYASLLWQPFVLVALLALTGRTRETWRFVHAWFLALIACVAIFPLVPAVGPYIHYGLTPADIPGLNVLIGWHHFEVIEPIRAGTMRLLSPASMTGMIAFPSFHAAGSVLLFWGFRKVPVIGPLFMALDVAMCLTAPLIGSHYFIDIVGGVAVAFIAIVASRRLNTFAA